MEARAAEKATRGATRATGRATVQDLVLAACFATPDTGALKVMDAIEPVKKEPYSAQAARMTF